MSSSQRKIFPFTLLGLLLSLLGATVLYDYGLRPWLAYARLAEAVEAPATIVELGPPQGKQRSREVTFRYVVDGVPYTSDYAAVFYQRSTFYDALAEKFERGEATTCYYAADDPSLAVLSRDPTADSFIALVLGLGLAVVGLYALWHTWLAPIDTRFDAPSAPAPLDLAGVRAVEAQLGYSFPLDYVDKMCTANGGELFTEEDDWELAPIANSAVGSKRSSSAPTADVQTLTAEAQAWHKFPADAVAIAENGLGDYLAFLPIDGTNRLGSAVYLFRHETGEVSKLAEDFLSLAVAGD